jgi:hypothetical protein
LQWNSDNTFDTWSGSPVNESDMITFYVEALLPFFGANTTFDNYIVYNVPTVDDDPQPVSSGAFTGETGTAGSPGWTKAVQGTFSIRTTNFGVFKITMLDSASGDNFDPSSALGGAALDLFNLVSDTLNGFSGRDNGRPNVFIKFTQTLNEKLRRSYRMT